MEDASVKLRDKKKKLKNKKPLLTTSHGSDTGVGPTEEENSRLTSFARFKQKYKEVSTASKRITGVLMALGAIAILLAILLFPPVGVFFKSLVVGELAGAILGYSMLAVGALLVVVPAVLHLIQICRVQLDVDTAIPLNPVGLPSDSSYHELGEETGPTRPTSTSTFTSSKTLSSNSASPKLGLFEDDDDDALTAPTASTTTTSSVPSSSSLPPPRSQPSFRASVTALHTGSNLSLLSAPSSQPTNPSTFVPVSLSTDENLPDPLLSSGGGNLGMTSSSTA